MIGTQESEINTVYIVRERSELEEGIITDEGGFLGLLGQTVVAPGIDQQSSCHSTRREQVITVNGKIDEILPKRSDKVIH